MIGRQQPPEASQRVHEGEIDCRSNAKRPRLPDRNVMFNFPDQKAVCQPRLHAPYDTRWPGRPNMKLLLVLTLIASAAQAQTVEPPPKVPFRVTLLDYGFTKSEKPVSAVQYRPFKEAKKKLRAAIYYGTTVELQQGLIGAKNRGVDTAVILDDDKANLKTIAAIKAEGVTCYIDVTHRIMHHKFVTIDGNRVLTGSANFTYSAMQVNAENTNYFISTKMAAIYEKEWDRIAKTAKPC